MHPFTYVRAGAVQQAISDAGNDPRTSFLAGGTTLIDLMKLHVETPARLVDINRVPETEIKLQADGSVRMGALARNTEVAYHPLITERFPVISQAMLSGASPQLRNMATVGGNLLQRTRCPYFRDTFSPCNKRNPGSGCAAMEGFNRSCAVVGTSESCVASNPSDFGVALTAMDAVVNVRSTSGERSIRFSDFHLLPGTTPHLETQLRRGELITSVSIPANKFSAKSHYLKFRDRASYEFALVSVAAAMSVENGVINGAKLALGGVGTKPWRCYSAEPMLLGQKPSDELFNRIGEHVMKDAKPLKYNGFKVELAKRAVVRALQTVAAM